MSWQLVLAYTFFSLFLYMQTRHVRQFQGGSQGFKAALGLSCVLALIFQAGFLIYVGFTVHWYTPILLYLTGFLLSMVLGGVLLALVPEFVLSLLGFAVVPIAAYFMVTTLRA